MIVFLFIVGIPIYAIVSIMLLVNPIDCGITFLLMTFRDLNHCGGFRSLPDPLQSETVFLGSSILKWGLDSSMGNPLNAVPQQHFELPRNQEKVVGCLSHLAASFAFGFGFEVLPSQFRVAGGCGTPLETRALVSLVVNMCQQAFPCFMFLSHTGLIVISSLIWQHCSGVQGTLIKGPNLRECDGKSQPGLPLKKCFVFHHKLRTD